MEVKYVYKMKGKREMVDESDDSDLSIRGIESKLAVYLVQSKFAVYLFNILHASQEN